MTAVVEVLSSCRTYDHIGRDGAPFVSYYDRALALSFIWDALSDVITISHGGYGEPVRWVIPTEPTGGRIDLAAFEAVCRAWVAEHEVYVARWCEGHYG